VDAAAGSAAIASAIWRRRLRLVLLPLAEDSDGQPAAAARGGPGGGSESLPAGLTPSVVVPRSAGRRRVLAAAAAACGCAAERLCLVPRDPALAGQAPTRLWWRSSGGGAGSDDGEAVAAAAALEDELSEAGCAAPPAGGGGSAGMASAAVYFDELPPGWPARDGPGRPVGGAGWEVGWFDGRAPPAQGGRGRVLRVAGETVGQVCRRCGARVWVGLGCPRLRPGGPRPPTFAVPVATAPSAPPTETDTRTRTPSHAALGHGRR
jgi:hypothetical protein